MLGRHIRLIVGMVFLYLLAVLFADFLRFNHTTRHLTPTEMVKADAIIALTGGSGLRIREGIRLLDEGHASRLLVSGVNKDLSPDALVSTFGAKPEMLQCCIDIGYQAASTLGNAGEANTWISTRDYGSIIVVTSDYHMPRSLALFRSANPDTVFRAHPVRTRIVPGRWWSSPRNLKGLVFEWAKYRVTLLTQVFS